MRKCRHCKTEIPKVSESTPIQAKGFCSFAHASDYGLIKAKASIAKKAKQKTQKASKDRLDLNRRHLPWQHEQCKTSFNRLRVQEEFQWFAERGLEPECISCGKQNMDWCCGHYKTVGAQSGLRYDRNCTFLQCNRYCNMGLSGNLSGNKTTRGYTQGLADRFGQAEADRIIAYCEAQTAPVKWDWQEMEAWRKDWNIKYRELSK
jgi:hypothetical protein